MNFNSKDAREFLKQVFTYLCAWNLKDFFFYIADDVIWTVEGVHPFAGTYRSSHAVKTSVLQPFGQGLKEDPKSHINEILVDNNRAAIIFETHIKTLDGVSIKYHNCWIVEVENKKISKVQVFSDTQLLSGIFHKEPLKHK